MTKRLIQDQVTGTARQPILLILFAAIVLFGGLVFGAYTLPTRSYSYLYLSLPIGIIGSAALVWQNSKPNLITKFLGLIAWGWLCGIVSFRAFTFFLPGLSLLLGFLIIGTTIFSQSLHLWNPNLTAFLKAELSFAPKTSTGKHLAKWALGILPIAGLIGSLIGLSSQQLLDGPILLELILGPLGWFLALTLPFSSQYPTSPWDRSGEK